MGEREGGGRGTDRQTDGRIGEERELSWLLSHGEDISFGGLHYVKEFHNFLDYENVVFDIWPQFLAYTNSSPTCVLSDSRIKHLGSARYLNLVLPNIYKP